MICLQHIILFRESMNFKAGEKSLFAEFEFKSMEI